MKFLAWILIQKQESPKKVRKFVVPYVGDYLARHWHCLEPENCLPNFNRAEAIQDNGLLLMHQNLLNDRHADYFNSHNIRKSKTLR